MIVYSGIDSFKCLFKIILKLLYLSFRGRKTSFDIFSEFIIEFHNYIGIGL